jgi:ferredoxin
MRPEESEMSTSMSMSTSRDEMDTLAAYELAWAEEGDGIEAAVAHCGCGGACESCRTSIERVERRAEALIAVEALRVAQARSEAARALGSRGGRVRGPSKARASAGDVSRAYWASLTPEQRREQGQIRAESRRRKKAEE